MRKKRWMILLFAAALLLPALIIWTLWANTALELNEYIISDRKLPEAFHGFRIAQVSDLHNAEFGAGNEELLTLLRDAEPDIIAITGDLIDSRRTDVGVALSFVREAMKIAPCYYVTGNHESRVAEYEALERGLVEAGVTVLRNDTLLLEREGQEIRLMGVDDCSFYPDNNGNVQVKAMEAEIIRMLDGSYTVLLSHRAELAVVYDRYAVDLVLSGHAHGGQVRLPFVGGIYAPDQGFFPKYTGGIYETEDQTLIVSRGLGNSAFPLRFNNRPEVVVVTLETE